MVGSDVDAHMLTDEEPTCTSVLNIYQGSIFGCATATCMYTICNELTPVDAF